MRRIEPLHTSTQTSLPGKQEHGLLVIGLAVVLFSLLLTAYWKHFDNEFEFDDDHCIVRNSSLDTMNVGQFMTDPSTYSTLPANQAWRPGITILNSFDTIRSKDRVADPFQFHLDIFISYVLLGVLIYFMLLWFIRKLFPDITWAGIAAILATGFFMLHTANAETINYIIARSDSQSTFFIVLGVVMFQYSELSRKYFLFIVPMALGFMLKESAIMLAPILLVFCWLFTPQFSRNILSIVLTFLAAVILYGISLKMTPDTWTSGGQDRTFLYLCTQAFVIVHYFVTFILPMELSADTDWTYVTTPFDTRVIVGALFITGAFYLAFRWAKNNDTKLAAFGVFWFFIALAPTSSVVPFSEVLNDHRIFFPFIGLIMVVLNFAVLAFRRFEVTKNTAIKILSFCFIGAVLLGHTYGTRKRCEVWDNNETLWKDVTEKSPANPRGWMNYGLAVMEHSVDSAVPYFQKTIQLSPGYVYAHINMGVAYDRLQNPPAAQREYEIALLCDSTNPEILYYYGEWMLRHEQVPAGLKMLRNGHTKSPSHSGINALLAAWGTNTNVQNSLQAALENADRNPTKENLVALSLEWYNAGEYLQCALTAEKATALDPNYAKAWINVCAGYNKIGEFDKALAAGEKAYQLAPEDPLSLGNLNVSKSEKSRFDAMTKQATQQPTYDRWIALSLEWYTANNFRKSLEAAQEAVKMNPNDAKGYNNVCAAANKLGEFNIAVEAGQKAVQLNPDWELAKNNLAEALRLKGSK